MIGLHDLHTIEMQANTSRGIRRAKKINIPRNEIVLLDKIGEGSFGYVYKGELLGATVAIKKTKHANEEEKESILNEAEMWFSIPDHPNICQFLGMCVDEGEILLLTEFMIDGSVKDCFQKDLLTMVQKYDILKQAAAGLWNLHTHGLVHGDVACRNILIDLRTLCVKVSDFGLMVNKKTGHAAHEGAEIPIYWAAPELLSSVARSCTFESDIWSYGVTSWELMMERTPHEGKEMTLARVGICAGKLKLEIDPTWHDKFKDLLERCWNHSTQQRPQIEEVYHIITNILQSFDAENGKYSCRI